MISKLTSFIKSFGSALASSMEDADSLAVTRISTPQLEKVDNYLGSMTIKKGHTLFKIEVSDEPGEGFVYNSPTTTFIKISKHKRELNDIGNIIAELKQGHIYVSALNEKNALKWYVKNHS